MTMNLAKTAPGALAAALLLAGCVESAAPLMTGAQPMFGPDVKVHLYELGGTSVKGPEIGVYRWDGGEYRALDKPSFEVAAFTAVPLAGKDFIIKSRSPGPRTKGT